MTIELHVAILKIHCDSYDERMVCRDIQDFRDIWKYQITGSVGVSHKIKTEFATCKGQMYEEDPLVVTKRKGFLNPSFGIWILY